MASDSALFSGASVSSTLWAWHSMSRHATPTVSATVEWCVMGAAWPGLVLCQCRTRDMMPVQQLEAPRLYTLFLQVFATREAALHHLRTYPAHVSCCWCLRTFCDTTTRDTHMCAVGNPPQEPKVTVQQAAAAAAHQGQRTEARRRRRQLKRRSNRDKAKARRHARRQRRRERQHQRRHVHGEAL
jgi:hypothetical protein